MGCMVLAEYGCAHTEDWVAGTRADRSRSATETAGRPERAAVSVSLRASSLTPRRQPTRNARAAQRSDRWRGRRCGRLADAVEGGSPSRGRDEPGAHFEACGLSLPACAVCRARLGLL
eukprot:scaffold211706_cov37-Tisochrysis_lutea.AAC.1